MNENEKNTFLVTEPLGRLMKKYSLPCVISLLVAALYNIVDQIFIANADYLGTAGNAANNVVFPLTVVALAVAVMIGDGCCAFVSICLGAHDEHDAANSVGSSVLTVLVSSVVLMTLYFAFQEPLLTAFGGRVNEKTFALAKEYFTWITAGLPFYMFGQAMNPIIRSDGSPRFAMATTLCGAAVNIVLDPVLIFVCRMGMMGAAVATVLGQVLTAGLSLWYICRMKCMHIMVSSIKPHYALMKKYIPLGVCSFLAQISLVAAMAANNNMITKYSASDEIFGMAEYSDIPMAVIGIVMKVFQIVISISIGLAAGCIPIVGYNIGAARGDRAKGLFKLLLGAEAAVGAVSLIIVELFPRQLIGIFGAAGESAYYTEFAVKAFRIYLCMMVLACINKAAFIFLQSMGKPWESTLLSMLREVVLGVGLALLLPLRFGLDGILLSMPVADILTFIVSVIIILHTFGELDRDSAKAA